MCLRAAAWIVLATYLVAGALLFVLARFLRFELALAYRALGPALLAALLDLDYHRWDAVRENPYAAGDALLVGALVGLALYGAQRAWAPASSGSPRAVRWLGAAGALVLAGLAVLPSQVSAPERATAGATKGHRIPRVLLLVVDTLRADALSYRSESAPPTPNIDRLAAQSFSFSNTRTPSSWTLPSMTSLMTGMSPLVHKTMQRDSHVPEALPTLAEELSAAGYRTGAVGHNYVLSRTRRLDRGFDHYGFDERRGLPAKTLGYLYLAHQLSAERGPELHFEVEADALNAAALEWIDERPEDDFFLWVHYYDPHLAYDPPADLRPEPREGDGGMNRFGHERLAEVRGGYLVLDRTQRQRVKALYDAEVRSLDRELGHLFDALRERGLYDETLIILTSDHGEEFWEHEGFEHGHAMHDEVLRVPLLIKLPGQATSAVVETTITLENVFPTVLALSGVAAADTARGAATSLFDEDGQLRAPAERTIASTGTLYFQDQIAILFGDWKYVRFLITGEERLFDLSADPGEQHSRVHDQPTILEQGRALCDDELTRAAELSEALGVGDGGTAELGETELQALRDLGYAD